MPEPCRLLIAFDYGQKRIGVATGNGLTRTASPLTTLAAGDGPPWTEIDALIGDWRPDLIVVGHPGPDASPALLEKLGEFLETIRSRFDIAVETVDERFTSTAAEESLRADRREGLYNRRLTREQIDREAACLIAEQWMNTRLD